MPAGKLDIYLEKGATWRHVLYWNIGTPPTPVDLTGFSARMQIRAAGSPAGTALLCQLTTENGRINLGQEPGRIELYISALDTEALLGLSAVYDLEMVNGEEVTRLVQGEVVLSPEVTRPT